MTSLHLWLNLVLWLLPASATHMQTPGVSVSHSPDPSQPTLAFAICSCRLPQSWRLLQPHSCFDLDPFQWLSAWPSFQLFNPGHQCSVTTGTLTASQCLVITKKIPPTLPPSHLQMRVPYLDPWASVTGRFIATPVSLPTWLLGSYSSRSGPMPPWHQQLGGFMLLRLLSRSTERGNSRA